MDKEKDLEVKEALPDYDRLYTVEEYYKVRENVRAELYEGILIVLESPSARHQGIVREIMGPLWLFLKGKPCDVFASFGVKPFNDEATIFEPDIIVVCDKSKIGKNSCFGAPDFIVEILSPSTKRMDKTLKYNKFQKAGVKEYWIIDPEQYILEAN